MPDLSLIPMDTLIKEVESRTTCFIAAYETEEDIGKKADLFNTWSGRGTWRDACSLSNILNNHCLNNWTGELQTLRRINKEESS